MPDYGGLSESEFQERALNAISELLHSFEADAMVQRFVLIVETIEPEGDGTEKFVSAFVAPDQKAWDTMGLLEWGMTIERNALLRDGGDD